MKLMNSNIHSKGMILVAVTLVTAGLVVVLHIQFANATKFGNFNCVGVANNCGSINSGKTDATTGTEIMTPIVILHDIDTVVPRLYE